MLFFKKALLTLWVVRRVKSAFFQKPKSALSNKRLLGIFASQRSAASKGLPFLQKGFFKKKGPSAKKAEVRYADRWKKIQAYPGRL
jgi:hypothetical protein